MTTRASDALLRKILTETKIIALVGASNKPHRDSHGVHAFVRPGEVNLMTGGHGICHSEVSTPDTTTLHGVQLWVALPDSARDAPRNLGGRIERGGSKPYLTRKRHHQGHSRIEMHT